MSEAKPSRQSGCSGRRSSSFFSQKWRSLPSAVGMSTSVVCFSPRANTNSSDARTCWTTSGGSSSLSCIPRSSSGVPKQRGGGAVGVGVAVVLALGVNVAIHAVEDRIEELLVLLEGLLEVLSLSVMSMETPDRPTISPCGPTMGVLMVR